jgi:hypothetical protein
LEDKQEGTRKENDTAQVNLWTTLSNLFYQADKEASREVEATQASGKIFNDKSFMKKLKSELKYFEICMRIFEESYIAVILHAKNEIVEQ